MMRLKKLPPAMDAAALERQAAEITAADAERRRLLAEQLHEMWLESVKVSPSSDGGFAYDDGGGAVMAALEAKEPGWRWREDRVVGHDDEDEPVYDWEHWRLSCPWLSPERQAAQEKELLAFERELNGPFHYVDRNQDTAKKAEPIKSASGKPRKPRKSRRKPVFWSPKKVD